MIDSKLPANKTAPAVLPAPNDDTSNAARMFANAEDLRAASAPEYSDEGIALQFTERYRREWRYVHSWGRWLFWAKNHWCEDKTLRAFDLARKECRQAADMAETAGGGTEQQNARLAAAIASKPTVAAVEALARADRAHAADTDQWDANTWLLNTPDGAIDLRSGKRRDCVPEDYCTKITAVAPGGECPYWYSFLDRITSSDDSLIIYLQRMVGYALTGDTSEHALFFLYGTGANGKSTFINTIVAILNSYATVAPAEMFAESHHDRHPTELAMLRGARLVAAIETEAGRNWAEARIKSLTGGDPFTARFMRQDFFTIQPQLKLMIAGNDKPGLRNVNEAIRRRMHLIPFTVTIPPSERDHALPEKLRAEWPGILAWAIQGCLDWQKFGLCPPQVVRDATDQYLADEDVIGIWLSERTKPVLGAVTSVAALHQDYHRWATKGGERFLGAKRFGQALESRGMTRERTSKARGFSGIQLIDDLLAEADS